MNPRSPVKSSTVFKTAALNHSAIPPINRLQSNEEAPDIPPIGMTTRSQRTFLY